MARSFNQVILMGNLTRDPELRQTPNGQNVCSFSLALNRQWKNQQGEQQEAVDYIDCIAWGNLGERVSQYLSKGRPALVVGRLQQRSWEQDGQKRSKVEVLANDVTFLGGPSDSTSNNSSNESYSSSSTKQSSSSSSKKSQDDDEIGDDPINLDDIPF